ncbi:hypothetical protein C8J56DRAFT_875240 [Mycena floridula]|nr:hypothetical protein C8J56DRAFT_875240 [Mycena floridula]
MLKILSLPSTRHRNDSSTTVNLIRLVCSLQSLGLLFLAMDAQPETAPVKEMNSTLSSCYVREAKIYDEGMVARWKVLMDGLLLFAALFSAVVTAFIIESYKTLSPDPSAMTVVLLYQISRQLSTITNATESIVLLPDFNSSPKLAVITNIFWFLSLALSLTCALTATLIEQWASDYIGAIERREAPEFKARIRAYLFEGVENSNVAAIVEGTPLLLHASLFSFFIGLIFFLHPISNIMTFLSAGILAVFGIAYLSATIAPLIDTASPIRTPLTTLVLQFSFARNFLRKTSLWVLRLASLVRLQATAGVLACWKRLREYSSVVAEIGRAWLWKLACQFRQIFSHKVIYYLCRNLVLTSFSAVPACHYGNAPFLRLRRIKLDICIECHNSAGAQCHNSSEVAMGRVFHRHLVRQRALYQRP